MNHFSRIAASSAAATMMIVVIAGTASAALSLNPSAPAGSAKWTLTGTCDTGAGPVSVVVKPVSTTGSGTNVKSVVAAGGGNCKNGGAGKSYTLDMAGFASGSWQVFLQQGASKSNKEAIPVP